MAGRARRKRNLAPLPRPSSRGYDVVIGARRKHFDSHSAARNYGLDQQNKSVHAEYVIVDSATGKRERYSRGGGKRNPSVADRKRMTILRIRLESERNKPKPDQKKIAAMMEEYRKLEAKPNPRRNPEAAAAEMRESFTGLPSKRTEVVSEDVHVHTHLAALGELIELKVKTLKGDTFMIEFNKEKNPKGKPFASKVKGWVGRRAKAFSGTAKYLADYWINPRKLNPKGPVLLCSTEDGKHLYIEGGDQKISLDSLGLTELKGKESAVIGTVTNVTYHARKKFDGKEEEYDYVHKFSEDSGGLRPMLRYDIRNQHLYLDGGVYHIPKPLVGVSQGITD